MPVKPSSGAQPLAPLGSRTLHLAIDLQRLFAEPTAWHTPALHSILPAVTRLAAAHPARTIFARFVPPPNAAAAPGRWAHYYRRWRSVTLDQMDPALLDLVAPLAALAEPARIIDKPTYSAFGAPAFRRLLEERDIDTLVCTGVETDVCVLATVLAAVDHGLRVVIPADAVASGSASAHAAVLQEVLPRLSEQVEVTDVAGVLGAW